MMIICAAPQGFTLLETIALTAATVALAAWLIWRDDI